MDARTRMRRATWTRRSFLMCALASGAALGLANSLLPLAAQPCRRRAEAGRRAVHRRGEVLPEAAVQEDQVQAVPARMHGGRPRARLLRRARKPRRHLLLAGAFAGVRGARRSHREEAAVPLPAGHAGFLAGHGRLQRQLQVLPELGHLPVAPGAGSRRLHAAAAGCRAGAAVWLPDHRLHLQRAGGLQRISDGCRRCRARGGHSQHCRVERLHAGGGAEGGVRKDGRGQDRPEVLLRVVLQRGGDRPVEAGAGFAGRRCARWASGRRSSTWWCRL